MRLTVFLLLFVEFLNASPNGLSQTVSLNVTNAKLENVMREIKSQTGLTFVYTEDLNQKSIPITLNVNKVPLQEALTKVFSNQPFTFKIIDNVIVIDTKNMITPSVELKTITNGDVVLLSPPPPPVTIKGKVTDDDGKPLAGASVKVVGTTRGATTDEQGNFVITLPPDTKTPVKLEISFISYATITASATEDRFVSVSLKKTAATTEEVVVIGYGTASKRDLTGSIVKVAGKEVNDKPNLNPLSSLQGKVSGVSIVNTGELGAEPDIRIRGTVSRTQTKPLYVVDGIFTDNIDYLNPSDIESMEILKDPSSLAIFGVRGANGAILITTKKGKGGVLTVNFNTSVGFKKMVDKIKLTNASQFKTLYSEQLVNQGAPAFDFSLYNANTDWQNEISQTGIINRNNISISSGTEKNKFYMGVGYQYEEGVVKNVEQQKISLSVSDELKVSNSIKLGFEVNGYQGQNPYNLDFGNAQNATPIFTPYNDSVQLFNQVPLGTAQIDNPLRVVTAANGHYPSTTYRFVGDVYAEINFLKHFTFKTTYYGDMAFGDSRTYTPLVNMWNIASSSISNVVTKTSITQDKSNDYKFQQDYLLTYKNKFGDHSLTVLGGFSTVYNSHSETDIQGSQYTTGLALPIPDDKRQWYLDNRTFVDPTSIVVVPPGKDAFGNYDPYQWDQSTVSYLARVLYNYKGKYMLNASFRRDGSSDISSSNRFQNFGAVGAAWEMTREKFMENVKFLDYLKIKGSWGILGNQYTSIHYPFYPILSSVSSAVFGPGANGVPLQTYSPSFIADPNLKWETISTYEAGIEFSLLKHLTGEFNYYNKLTKNLLTSYPAVNGQKQGITNAGEISNTGIELSLNYSGKTSFGLGYMVSGNITTLKNKVKSLYLGAPIYDGPSITQVGSPIGSFFGYVVSGIVQSSADSAASPLNTVTSGSPGEFKYKDLDGNDSITSNDRKIIGNPTPKIFYGFSLGLTYKGFDFSMDFQGVGGNQIFRNWGNGFGYAPVNYREARMNRWHGAGTSNWEPRVLQEGPTNSNYMIESGSYLRIRNIQLGYSFNTADLSRLYIKSLRVYASAQNLKTFKKNSGYTPEFGGTATQFGVDNGSYPIPAVYTLGLNVNF